jgi:hypothetical protein
MMLYKQGLRAENTLSSFAPLQKGCYLFMKRIVMLLAPLALMFVAAMALSGVAQAASPSAMCKQEATSLGISGSYTFIGGSAGNDNFTDNFTSKATARAEVFCGFGGDDHISHLAAGDIFLGGAGNDSVNDNFGTFNGGADDDTLGGDNLELAPIGK